jgi:hypothetical protein
MEGHKILAVVYDCVGVADARDYSIVMSPLFFRPRCIMRSVSVVEWSQKGLIKLYHQDSNEHRFPTTDHGVVRKSGILG